MGVFLGFVGNGFRFLGDQGENDRALGFSFRGFCKGLRRWYGRKGGCQRWWPSGGQVFGVLGLGRFWGVELGVAIAIGAGVRSLGFWG